MKSIEERVRNVNVNSRYDAMYSDLKELYELAAIGDIYEALCLCFKFGYLKGRRAAAAEAKKKG